MLLDIIFYHNESGSTSSQKVKLCLDYKGLDYKSINVDLGQKQNQSPEYLKINRHGLVPALSHDGHVLLEANLINEYLDRVFPEKPLLPKDPLLLHKAQYLCKQQEYVNEQCLRYLSYLYTGRVSMLSENDINGHSQLDRRRFLRDIRQGLPDANRLEIESYLFKELVYVDGLLLETDWLCGDAYSLADIAWTAALYRVEQLGKMNLLHEGGLTNLERWYERIKAMDHFRCYNL